MSAYDFLQIEKKWQETWRNQQIYHTEADPEKPKYYVLDMFPYPSGAGLHVGHPLGYIATDIVTRYKRAKGFNVLHPMGFDSFGLPAEQYAVKTGQHPAITTEANIKRFKEQLEVLGFSYDWNREIRTSDPSYYKWTQWIFLQLFNSYYDEIEKKAKPISELTIPEGLTKEEQQEFINNHRLAYQDEIAVNWCPALGTVLANEEVVGGVSERGGHPVIRKPMRQWMLRITKYGDRLLQGLEKLDWPESIKTSQRNWIGKSYGAEVNFPEASSGAAINVFTTRPDTIFGVTYMVLAPEHPLVKTITTEENLEAVADYLEKSSRKSDLERTDLDKSKTGVFTGAYAINPINREQIPIWISDYVLISYGTGAIMAVPGGDQRDYEFAEKFEIPIVPVVQEPGKDIPEDFYAGHGTMINSGEYNGMDSQEFTKVIVERIEKEGHGKAAVNYKLRDWIFTRQRYWGEPIPLIHSATEGVVAVPEDQLPVILPEVSDYQPTQDGESPLAKAQDWVNTTCPVSGEPAKRETNTMPQWAGSCWYYLRFMDPHNDKAFADPQKMKHWSPVDLYIGGAEHAVLHLLYARFWHKVLFDLGHVPTDEPFQKLVNQGMIQGRSNFAYRIKDTNTYVSLNLKDQHDTTPIHVDISLCQNDILDLEGFKQWQPDLKDAEFILEDGKYICGAEVEKMSKSKLNVVSPDHIITKYGADTMRMYEMFLGPLEQGKPWSTHGIDGVFKFLRKFWRLFFHHESGELLITDHTPTTEELKITHATIKKVGEDIERLSLNTAVSAFMICVNELTAAKCHKREVLQDLVVAIAPFAPHLAEELWEALGNSSSVTLEPFPKFNEDYLQEDMHEYPVSVNGKMRAKMKFALDMPKEDIEKEVLAAEVIQRWVGEKTPKKVIVVPGKIVNVVV